MSTYTEQDMMVKVEQFKMLQAQRDAAYLERDQAVAALDVQRGRLLQLEAERSKLLAEIECQRVGRPRRWWWWS